MGYLGHKPTPIPLTSADITDGTIALADMAVNSIDSDQYVDGSIDEAHIADNAVSLAKMAGGTDGNIISFDASGNPVAIATGNDGQVLTSAGAGAPPAFEAAAGGGDTRNFIIDGDFTQWPSGTSFADIGNNVYASALWRHEESTTVAAHTLSRHTDIPTVAQSKHQSAYSMDWNCTTIDASIGADDLKVMQYYITGSDFTYLHQQQVTLAFWIKATVTGTQGGSFVNSAYDRSYPFSFTVSDADTWEYKTVSLTMDTSGTWLFTEADIGTRVRFCVVGGSNRIGTANTWQSGNVYGPTGIVNNVSSTSNIYRIAQVGLYLGSSAPSTFLGEPVTTVRNQVDYYVQRYNYDETSGERVCMAACTGTNGMTGFVPFRAAMRKAPTITTSAVSTFNGDDGIQLVVCNVFQSLHATKHNVLLNITQAGTNWTDGNGAQVTRAGTSTSFIMADARH